MDRKKRWLVGAAVAVAGVAGGATVVSASGVVDDSEPPITGTALKRASDAALAEVGSGKVTDTEVGDEEGFYEVEVTLEDGSEVDVHLDEGFRPISSEPEDKDESEESSK